MRFFTIASLATFLLILTPSVCTVGLLSEPNGEAQEFVPMKQNDMTSELVQEYALQYALISSDIKGEYPLVLPIKQAHINSFFGDLNISNSESMYFSFENDGTFYM